MYRIRCLLLMFASLCCTPLLAADDGYDLPLRKGGLWEVRTQTDEGEGVHSQQLTLCIGDDMERETVLSTGRDNRANCSQYHVAKASDVTTVDAHCVYDERQVTNHTELRGDFKTTFKVDVVSSVAGMAPRSMGGQPVNVHRTIRQEGKYIGASCGALHAGEARTAEGKIVSVQ